jgi:hypothetical protein
MRRWHPVISPIKIPAEMIGRYFPFLPAFGLHPEMGCVRMTLICCQNSQGSKTGKKSKEENNEQKNL